ncbi:hypothetical protein [Sedimentitalea todarodis]|uniref:VanZ-like domain-containing protein n=1 Tax=Sedimentitalea todarodis TaxID=1631240 RepID=A0ABU3V9T8_9RHOB|nr:hypothetical protein [Sedimentitalea todarodis]MDU9002929.1 hypothetical protein [Sedimentitalea todarodis]
MEAETSAYQAFKLWLAGYIPLDRNTLHYLIGAGLLAAAMVHVRNRPRTRPLVLALIVAIALGAAMELADLRDDVATLGYWRWRASLLDFGRTIAFPLAGVLLARWLLRWPTNAPGR